MAPKKRRKKNPRFIDWRNSLAKQVILVDLADGILDPETSPEDAWDVYKRVDGFENVIWEQFEARFKDHCKAFLKRQQQNQLEEMLYEHDKALHPRTNPRDSQGRLIFHRHAAKKLLRSDINNQMYPNVYTPRELWRSRPEYQEFELKVFTQRIYQEIRRNKFINWCQQKRAEKEETHAEHRRQRDYTFS